MFDGVGNKLIDEEAKGNRLVRRNHQVAEFAVEFVPGRGFLQLMAKLAGKVGDVDESDLLAAPKMIVHLRDRGDARGRVLEGILDVFRLGVAGLDAKQPHDRCETVLDAVAHLARQHGLVVEGGLKFRIGMLPLYGDAEQSGEARQEIGVRKIELTGIGTIDFQHAERQVAFAAPRNENIDRAPDPVVRQKLRRPEACLLLKVVGNHYLPGVKRITSRRFHIGSRERHDRWCRPAIRRPHG